MSKTDTIEKVYNDFYGSIKSVYEEAKKIDNTIKYDDIKKYFEQHRVRRTNLKGYNSFIADHYKQEYQIDLFFINESDEQEYGIGLLIIDIFSKFMIVIPLKSKQPQDMLDGIKEGFRDMGGKPESVYTDDEGSLNSKLLQDYFKEHNIKHITTRTHAAVAERAVRTIKDLIYRRLEKNPTMKWYDDAKHRPNISAKPKWYDVKILANSLVMYNYKMVSSSTGMTPNNAREKKNELDVKLKLELGRKTTRTYPPVEVNDKVRIYKKKGKFDKERVPVWSENSFNVDKIEVSQGQKFYHVAGRDKPLLRHEILKVT